MEVTSTNYGHRRHLGRLAYEAHLPSIDTNTDAVEAGALMSYAASSGELRRMAHHIDKICKGVRLGDLPMELPTKVRIGDQSQDGEGDRHHEFRRS